MGENKRFVFLIAIMVTICLIATGISTAILYRTALEVERERLTETAQSQARLIEAIARFDDKYTRAYPEGPVAATLSQIKDAHRNYKGFGQTGEFTLARRVGNDIVFLLSHRHHDLDDPKPVSLDSNLAEPMRLALSGKSGTIIGLDYRGEEVLAAYEPVYGLDLGIVAKLDMDEIRAPFVRAALIVLGVTVVLIVLGSALFFRISNPIIRRLMKQNRKLAEEIEERKRYEETLRDNELFLKTLLDAIPIPVFYKDRNQQYLGFNRSFETFLGRTKEQLVGKTVVDIMPGEFAEVHRRKDEELIEKGGTKQYECQIMNTNEMLHDVIIYKAAFNDKKGKVSGLIGTIIDVTEDKLAEVELRNREQLLNELGSIAKIGGWEHDLVTGKATWTKETYRILEIEESDLIPGPDEHLNYYPQDDRALLADAYRRSVETGEQFDLELQCRTAKGRRFWARAIGRPEFDREECVKMKGTFQDITERKKLEEHLQQSEKMESIGKLAGGVAHDYNNMLSVIIGYTELAIEKAEQDTSLHADLNEVLNAAMRSTDITRQLLAFARQQTIAPKVVDLNDIAESMLKMLRRLIGEDIDLAWIPGKNIWSVNIDPSQIDQILANLCVNARDAIRDIGKVTIETKNVRFDQDYCEDHEGFIPGEYVMLAVSDDGKGMAPETLNKVFEPFFTTKGLGQGTGLGLSTVYGIVKQNNGFINIYSEPEKGTTVKVYFSRHTGQTVVVHRTPGEDVPLSRGEFILVVEDDEAILELSKRILEDLGYKVLAAASPSEATQLAGEHAGDIDLLITDVVMPEMNGRELSEKLQIQYPELKTLYMSGYTANVIAHRGVLEEGVFFVPKPFSKRDMAIKVREALDTSNNDAHSTNESKPLTVY